MELILQEYPTYYLIFLNGELDLYNSFKLKEAFNIMIKKDIKKYIIDFKGLKYIDSSGIGALIRINSLTSQPDMSLKMVNMQGQVKEMIKLTKLHEYFPIVENLEKAVKELEIDNIKE